MAARLADELATAQPSVTQPIRPPGRPGVTGRGVTPDDALAFESWKSKAFNGDAVAQFNLGLLYANGRGVDRNDEEAVRWYRTAAGQGHALGQCNLGYMFENGRGVRT